MRRIKRFRNLWRYNPRMAGSGERYPEGSRQDTPGAQCEYSGCEKTTKKGKPYCVDHIEHTPEIQRLLESIEAQHSEQYEVSKKGAKEVKPGSIVADDIIKYLMQYGDIGIDKLSQDLIMDKKTLRGYISYLRRMGKVRIKKNTRGIIIVKLISRDNPSYCVNCSCSACSGQRRRNPELLFTRRNPTRYKVRETRFPW